MTAPRHTRGSVALRNCGQTAKQIAQETGIAYSVVQNHREAHRKPQPKARKLYEQKCGIDFVWWDQPAPANPSSILIDNLAAIAAETLQSAGQVPLSQLARVAESEAEALIRDARKLREQAQNDPVSNVVDKSQVLVRCGTALEKAYKITGENAHISEAKLLKSAAWQRVKSALLDALRPFPDALRAAGAALEGLDR